MDIGADYIRTGDRLNFESFVLYVLGYGTALITRRGDLLLPPRRFAAKDVAFNPAAVLDNGSPSINVASRNPAKAIILLFII